MQVVEIGKIRIDGGTQARAAINTEKVAEYAIAMEDGVKFDHPVVFFDGAEYWLADGFHRYHASKKCDFKSISCDVREGTKRDAILFAVGANATHGLHRSNADKRKAVMILLEDAEWQKKSARWIAETACVSTDLVSEMKSTVGIDSQKVLGRDGRATKPKPNKKTISDDIPMVGLPVSEPKPDPAPKPKAKPKDKVGNDIDDDSIADCFTRYGEISSLCSQLSQVLSAAKKAITNSDPLFGRTNESALKAHIGNARRELTINEPHALCPACGGNRPKTCKVCKGTKYATKDEYERYEASIGIGK